MILEISLESDRQIIPDRPIKQLLAVGLQLSAIGLLRTDG
jgi:hypothetical protein